MIQKELNKPIANKKNDDRLFLDVVQQISSWNRLSISCFSLCIAILFFPIWSYSQTWIPIPFTQANNTGSVAVCGGVATVTVTNSFINTTPLGSVNLNTSTDVLGVITFSSPVNIRVEDRVSSGSNNGDVWNLEGSAGTTWTSFGAEASSTGTDLDLTLTSVAIRSGGETVTPTSSLTISKSVNGGAIFLFFDGNVCTVLPIELLNFDAFLTDNKQVKLNWKTASEINNDYFTIERSQDELNWEELAVIDGAGNSSSIREYTFNDKNPYKGISYYRLKQTDFDGKFSYSQIRSLKFEKSANSQIEIYPNPTTNQITIIGNEFELEEIKIYNISGEDITTFTSFTKNSAQEMNINLSNLNTGLYYIKTKNTANKVYKQ